MSWKPALLTKNNRPPQIVATIKDDMLKLVISQEITALIGLRNNQSFSAFIGTAGEHGQVKIVASDGGGKVKGSTTSPTVYIPAESSWQTIDEPTKCDYEVVEDEKTLVVNLPFYTGQTPEILHGNQKLTTPMAARMLDQYRRGASRRKLAEYYGVSEATVVVYTNNPEDVASHNTALRSRKAAGEATALLGNATTPSTANGAATPPVTVCPPRSAAGLRKAARY